MKIFGIGLNKTGTSTLGRCCEILGYRATGYSRKLLADVRLRNNYSRVLQTAKQYDAFEDWPWPLVYEAMDRALPGSKFILTLRKNPEVWLNSLKSHSMRTGPFGQCRRLAYGHKYPHGKEREHIAIYNGHRERVREYFQGRAGDMIELCWESGDGWPELCRFLGVAVPDVPFPHVNQGARQRVWKARLLTNRLLSRMGY